MVVHGVGRMKVSLIAETKALPPHTLYIYICANVTCTCLPCASPVAGALDIMIFMQLYGV